MEDPEIHVRVERHVQSQKNAEENTLLIILHPSKEMERIRGI